MITHKRRGNSTPVRWVFITNKKFRLVKSCLSFVHLMHPLGFCKQRWSVNVVVLGERSTGVNFLGDRHTQTVCVPVKSLKSCQEMSLFISISSGGSAWWGWNQCHPAAGYHRSRFRPLLDKQIYRFPFTGNLAAREPPRWRIRLPQQHFVTLRYQRCHGR